MHFTTQYPFTQSDSKRCPYSVAVLRSAGRRPPHNSMKRTGTGTGTQMTEGRWCSNDVLTDCQVVSGIPLKREEEERSVYGCGERDGSGRSVMAIGELLLGEPANRETGER